MPFQLTDRERSWIDALLILATVAVGFIVAGFVSNLFFYFGDVVLVFFLAWLLAFILSPIVAGILRLAPRLPRVAAVVVVYAMLLGALSLLVLLVAQALASSITDFIAGVPRLQRDLPTILAPWQERLRAIGLGQVDLAAQGQIFLSNLNDYAAQLVGPVQQLAVASLGALGNVLLDAHPVALHGHRQPADHVVPAPARPAGLRRGGPPPRDQHRPLVRRLPPRPGGAGLHVCR